MPVTHSVSLVHNDYKFDNVVLDPHDLTKIAGVLDWEMCTIGDSLTDLGTTVGYWVDPSDPEELKKHLADVTTQPGSLTRTEVVQRYAQQNELRRQSNGLLPGLRPLQTSGHHPANLLSLSPGPNQRRPFRRHARTHQSPPPSLPPHRPNRPPLARVAPVAQALLPVRFFQPHQPTHFTSLSVRSKNMPLTHISLDI